MKFHEKILALWNDIDKQNWDNIRSYFEDEAIINWNNTNERFTVEEFIKVNSEYPGDWNINIERLECIDKLVISVVRVQLKNENISVHATSFFEFSDDKIKVLNEYWGDDGKAVNVK